METLNDILTTPLSPNQLKNIGRKFNMDVPIVMYDKIISSQSLDDLLLNYPNGFVIFYPNLREGNNLSGHYVCLFLRGNTIHFYDSYGDKPDFQKQDVPQRDILYNENINSLVDLLYRSPYQIDYNNFKHQLLKNDSATCGRHSIMRLLHQQLDTKQYDKELKRLCKKFKVNPDELVSIAIQ